MKTKRLNLLSFFILVLFLTTGCSQNTSKSTTIIKPVPVTQLKTLTGPIYKGKIIAISNKGKQITISTGKGKDAKTLTVSFDEQTRGIEQAAKGHRTVIAYKMRGGIPFATDIQAEQAKLPPTVTIISAVDVNRLIKGNSDFVLIDSRSARRYSISHLPGAISIPVCKMQALLPNLPKDKNTLLIFYCGGATCGMSSTSAGLAVKAGYTNIRVLLSGEPAWIKEGLPTYSNSDFISQGNAVIIDLRSEEKSTTSRIVGAVSIPFSQFTNTYHDIPLKAPVVLYSDNDEETMTALRTLRANGYKKVTLVEGGFDGWKRSGVNISNGPVFTKVHWQHKHAEGEVSVAEFEKAIHNPSSAIILDVRTDDEVNEGKLAGSQHISLDQLYNGMDQFTKHSEWIKKGQKIYIYCSTGARAEMAYKELKTNGFNAYYLVAKVECKGSDCSIEK